MNFTQALDLMKQGKKVRRKCWKEYKDAPKYIYLGKRNIHNDKKMKFSLCNIHSLEAEDWEEYEEELIEKDIEYLDKEFPKGEINSLRGDAMVLLALAREQGKKEKEKEFNERVERLIRYVKTDDNYFTGYIISIIKDYLQKETKQ